MLAQLIGPTIVPVPGNSSVSWKASLSSCFWNESSQIQLRSSGPVSLGIRVLGKWLLQEMETDRETLREPGLLWQEALLWGGCPQMFHLLFWSFVWRQDLHSETDLLGMNEAVGVVKPQDIWGEAENQTFRQLWQRAWGQWFCSLSTEAW